MIGHLYMTCTYYFTHCLHINIQVGVLVVRYIIISHKSSLLDKVLIYLHSINNITIPLSQLPRAAEMVFYGFQGWWQYLRHYMFGSYIQTLISYISNCLNCSKKDM